MIEMVKEFQYREIDNYALLDDFECGVSCMDKDLHSDYRRCGFRQLELQQKGMTVVPMWRPID